MQKVRIYEIPDCRMVSSGIGMFGDGVLERFCEWFSGLPRGIYPENFLFWDCDGDGKQGFNWICLYREGMDVPEEFSVIDFRGGLYAVATDIDRKTDMDAMRAETDAFLNGNGFERDKTRPDLGNVITGSRAKAAMGYEQMNYWFPVKEKQPAR